MKQIFLYVCLLVWISSPAVQASETHDAPRWIDRAAMDEVLRQATRDGFVGVVGISDGSSTIFSFAVGDAVAGEAPYGEVTLVDIASITKQFTGAAILKLREQGKVQLSDRLDDFFKDVPENKKAITLHQLLTHTAGLADVVGQDQEAIERDDYLARAFAAPLVAKPGTRYEYSNMGYSLLAAIIEVTSGQAYEDYLFDNLWKPAGMYTTGYYRPDWSERTVPQIAVPHDGLSSAKDVLDRTGGKTWHLFGNGGVLSTAPDMLRWHRALLGTKILSAESKELLFAPHVSEGEEGYYYGYGWSIVPDYKGKKLVWHNGGSHFSRAEFWRFPETGMAIFIATHSKDVEPYFMADALAKILNSSSSAPERK
ncbi:serine hydrolase domain-containing protein [Kordiimonas lipolytica]|uniref:Serine hydrolase domain-containing protein n=1 Tax=Kordiimonas lipolytica TaxID=1662421 RepID=A0ABV8UBV3_9PROT|nr:serine hydrolase domain-containing protein [Kordiimonas lipolytica]